LPLTFIAVIACLHTYSYPSILNRLEGISIGVNTMVLTETNLF